MVRAVRKSDEGGPEGVRLSTPRKRDPRPDGPVPASEALPANGLNELRGFSATTFCMAKGTVDPTATDATNGIGMVMRNLSPTDVRRQVRSGHQT
jgi:hypothetical protein